MTDREGLLTPEQAAEITRRSLETVLRWIEKGALRPVRRDGEVFVRTADVQKLRDAWEQGAALAAETAGDLSLRQVEMLRVALNGALDQREEKQLMVTKSGRVLTDSDVEALAAEAERGYDVEQLVPTPIHEVADVQRHDWEPGEGSHPMHTDPPCRTCGEPKNSARHR